MNKVDGMIKVAIVKSRKNLLEDFKKAFESTVKDYINVSGFKVIKLEFEEDGLYIKIKYSFEKGKLEYAKYENELKSGSTMYSSEIGRSLYEFWCKWVVKTFFNDELIVKGDYITIKFFDVDGMKEKFS